MPWMTTNLICLARTRKPETLTTPCQMQASPAQSSCPVLRGRSDSPASLHRSRATLSAFVSSHIQPQFPESVVASFYLFDAGLSSLTARPGQRDPSWHRCTNPGLLRPHMHAVKSTRNLDFRLHSAKRSQGARASPLTLSSIGFVRAFSASSLPLD
jgi:hypothetical protein